jgi:predicted RNase H-like HicB family nuclease
LGITMNYPIAIHKDPDTDYGVIVPDLPGCYSAGSTIDEALVMAREAVELHLESLRDDGLEAPAPSTIEALHRNPDYADAIWAVVSVELPTERCSA